MKKFNAVAIIRMQHEAQVCEHCNTIFKVDRFQEGFLKGERVLTHIPDMVVEYCPMCGKKSPKRNVTPDSGEPVIH